MDGVISILRNKSPLIPC